MDAKEAAKVLREHVEIRRKAGTGNPCLNQAIDAAVIALEAIANGRYANDQHNVQISDKTITN